MVNSDKTLVAYLDVLGYKEIIQKVSPEQAYNSILTVFKELGELWDTVLPKEIKSESDHRKACQASIFKAIKFNILSDTIIMCLNCDDVVSIQAKVFQKIEHDYSAIILFLHAVATFNLLFIKNTGYLLRGGIALGKFYKNSFSGSMLQGDLIFSKAFVDAYLLEQKALCPRILVDECLACLWNEKVASVSANKILAKEYVKRDADSEYYLDFYELTRAYDVDFKRYWLNKITSIVKEELSVRKSDKRVYSKWFWFKEYHNRKIKIFVEEEKQDLVDLIIED